MLDALPSGSANVNDVVTQFANLHLPFGGLHSSGMGSMVSAAPWSDLTPTHAPAHAPAHATLPLASAQHHAGARLGPPPSAARACRQVSGAILAEHPLVPCFRDLVITERRRRDRPRPWAAFDKWMLFAGDNDAIYYFNFEARQRSRELPAELAAAMRKSNPKGKEANIPPSPKAALIQSKAKGGAPKLSQAEMSKARKNVALGKRPKLAAAASAPSDATAAAQASSAAARAAAKQRGAELVSASHRWRHSTLQIWPRSLPEVLFASRQLGIDVDTQPALLWLVDAIIASGHLPVAWSQKTRLSSSSSYAEVPRSNRTHQPWTYVYLMLTSPGPNVIRVW